MQLFQNHPEVNAKISGAMAEGIPFASILALVFAHLGDIQAFLAAIDKLIASFKAVQPTTSTPS